MTEHMTETPPMTPPTIAGEFDLARDDVFFFLTVPLGLMLSTGTLREHSASKNEGIYLYQL